MSAPPTDRDGLVARARRPCAGPLLDGRRIDARGQHPGPDEITYTVIEAPRPARSTEKRDRPRQRTRLRSGKVVDTMGRFLTECLIYDRSEAGGRLRLPAGSSVPPVIQLYEDQSAALWQADVMWRAGLDIGVRLRPAPATARTRALEAALRRRFYAVPE